MSVCGQAKIMCTLTTIEGAMIMTLVCGPNRPTNCIETVLKMLLSESLGKFFFTLLNKCCHLIPDPFTPTPNAATSSTILRFMDMETNSLLIHQDGMIRVYSFCGERCEGLFDIKSQPFYQTHDHRFHLTALLFGESLALVWFI